MKHFFTKRLTNLKLARSLALTLAFLGLMSISVNAQNLALSATFSHSTGGTGAYGPTNYNDQVIQFNTFAWASGSGASCWIVADWGSTSVNIDTIKIYNNTTNTRCLTAGDIQGWNGSSWVTHYTFSSAAVSINEIVLPTTLTTTRMRITNVTISGFQTTNPSINEMEIFERASYGSNNLGVTTITPGFPCAGSNDIKVNVRNFGQNVVNNFTVNWTINGVSQTPYNYNSTALDTNGGAGINDVTLTLGSHTFINNDVDTIRAWTSAPNGGADTVNTNDTIQLIKKPSLNGTFTVGGVGADYATLQAAFNDLMLIGACGPVVLQMDGSLTYSEQVIVGSIPGASSVNTVTVKGDNALLEHDGDGSNYSVFTFEDASWVILDSLRVKNTGNNTNDFGVLFTGSSSNCTVKNCLVTVRDDYSSTRSIPILLSGSKTRYNADFQGSSITVENNTTYGGYYGITLYSSYGGGSSNNLVKGNTIEDFYRGGMYIRGMKETLVQGNDISRPTRTSISTFYGIYMYNGNTKTTLDGNKIHTNKFTGSSNSSTVYGIYAQYEWFSLTDNDNAITNNLIYNIDNDGGTQEGIRLFYAYDFLVANNTVVLDDSSATGGQTKGISSRDGYDYNEIIRNNNIYITRGGSGSKSGISIGGNNSTNYPIVENNNVFVGGTGTGTLTWGSYLGSPGNTAEEYNDIDNNASGNIEVNPEFRDPANANYEPKDARLNGAGTAVSEVTIDIDGVSRGSATLDVGAYYMGCDFGITTFTLPNATECELHTPEITVTLKNYSTKEYVNIPLGLSVDGSQVVTDYADISLASSGTGNYTFKNEYTFRDPGVYNLEVYPLNDEVLNNDTQSFSLTILPAPRGSVLTQGTGFTGLFRSGAYNNFDVTKAGDAVEYEISIPTSGGNTFTDANYGSVWTIPLTVETESGATLPGSMYSVTAPTSTTGAIITFTPDNNYTDSMLLVKIPVKDLGNGCDSTILRWIFVAPVPKANFKAPDVCDGDGIGFENLSEISTGTMEYEWDFGLTPVVTSTNTSPVFKYPTFGVYDVKLTATSNWGYTHDTIIKVTVFESPNVKFRPINACEGDAVQFENNTSVSTGTLTYTWDFGDGNGSIAEEPSHTYGTAGEYTVTLTAEVSGCKRALQKSAFQFPQPTADFEVQNAECNQKEIEFTNKSTLSFGRLGNLWDFGDLNYSTESNTLHTFETAGTQTITLTVQSEFGCSDVVVKQIELKEAPVADFTNTQTCDIDPVIFTNGTTEPVGTNVDYSWNFGDPTSNDNTSNLTNPEHGYSLPGPRKVTLTAVADNGCIDEITKDIVVGVQPQADFSMEDGCTDQAVKFNNETTISRGDIEVTYDWSFGSTDVSPENVFTTAGTFDVTLTATATEGGCTDEITKQITIAETPSCEFTTATTGQLDVTFTPDETDPNFTYVWLFGDGGSSSEMTPTYEYTFAKNYEITLMVTSPEGCQCSSTVFNNQTSTDDINLSERVSIYPNPNNGNFTVEVAGNLGDGASIEVYNSLGAVVAVVDVNKSVDGKYTINLDNVAAGVYTVKVSSEASVYTQKVTVVK